MTEKTWIAKLPEKSYTCPSCCRTVTISRGRIAVDCLCGELVFRPLYREAEA